MSRRTRQLLGLTLLVAVTVSACGGGGDDDERSGDAASADRPAPETTPTPDGTPATEDAAGCDTDTGDSGDGGVSIGEDGISVGGDGEGGGISIGEDGVDVDSGEGRVSVGEGGVTIESCFGDIEVGADDGGITISGPDGDVAISVDDAVTELGGEDTDEGISVPLPESVLFDFDSAALLPAAGEELGLVAGLAAAYPDATLEIGGHTDAVGEDVYNQQLSEQRATAVRDALAVLGVAGDRMTATGYGETRPVAPDTTPAGADDPAGRQRNRRVEILLVGADL